MRVTLYSKPDCHLCDDVKADLQALRQELGFTFLTRNIEDDAADFERFRYLIPVVDIADGPMLYAPIDPFELRQVLTASSIGTPER